MNPQIHAVSQDGLWSVIEAKDFDEKAGYAGRSRTRDTPGDALKATWEPGLNVMPGIQSLHKFIKVRTMDLPKGATRVMIPVNAKDYSEDSKYPKPCLVCGQKNVLYVGSTNVEHKGECPGPPKKEKNRWV